jgi:hypothetical protein
LRDIISKRSNFYERIAVFILGAKKDSVKPAERDLDQHFAFEYTSSISAVAIITYNDIIVSLPHLLANKIFVQVKIKILIVKVASLEYTADQKPYSMTFH